MMKNFMKYYLGKFSIVLRSIVVALLIIHSKTMVWERRRIVELFYWPEGLCVDFVVVMVTLVIALVIVICDFYQINRYMRNK